MGKNDYIATERLYLNKKGEVVGAKDPSKETLLVAEGCALPYADAVKYGLINTKPDAQPSEDLKPEEKATTAVDAPTSEAPKAEGKSKTNNKK